MADKTDDPSPEPDYQAVLQASMEESRRSRQAAAPLPNAAGYGGRPDKTPQEGVLLGAVGDPGGIARVNTPPRAPAQSAPAKRRDPLPFEVIAPKNPSTSQVLARVHLFSYLLKTLIADDRIDINQLDTDFPIADGQRVWLELDIENNLVTEANISSDGAGDSWDTFPSPGQWSGTGTADDPYVQEKAFVLLAECKTPANGDPPGPIFSAGGTSVRVIQKWSTNMIVYYTNQDLKTLVFVQSYAAPSTLM